MDNDGTVIDELIDDARDVIFGNGIGLREYTVQPGDNLTTIAKQYYGSCEPRYALAIYQANKDKIADPNNVYPGQVLMIPHVPHKASWHA